MADFDMPPGRHLAPRFEAPPLKAKRPPRCPPYLEVTNPDQLLPYLEHVARRPYNHGLNACWDLKAGEKVLLRVDNWHSPMVIEACKKILEKYRVDYTIKHIDRGPVPQWVGADEVEYYLFRTKELAQWMDEWDEIAARQEYQKILMGYGGPVLTDRYVKIQRMPFITPEILASPAHAMPIDVLNAVDEWMWKRIRAAKRVRITDPEGTDISFTNHDEYWDERHEGYNPKYVNSTWEGNPKFGATYLPGHITGRPWIYIPQEDGCGVIAGTTNHIAPCDWTQLIVENSRITRINAGGDFGDKLRDVMEQTKDIQYPGFPGKGLMYWWEASIGTNPHIHRPRKDFPSGFVNCLYERVRSGVIHMGFGTIISSMDERRAARMGHLVGHWHLHLYFPTYEAHYGAGDSENLITNGRLAAFDDPEIRALCSRYGDPELWLDESWNPAVPGLNMPGDYWDDYARDPLAWVKHELEVCRTDHPRFMRMTEADAKYCHGKGRDFWAGGCCDHSGVGPARFTSNCCE